MASLTFYGGVSEIGGNKVLVEDNDTRIFLDFGMSFDRKGDFYEEFLQPRTNNGLKDLMELGIVPKLDGIYRKDLLEIEGIEDVINETAGNDNSLWMSNVKSYDEITKRDGNPFVQGILISHGHLDHFQYISFLDERIPVYCSSTTKAIIEATEDIGKGDFESESLSVRKREIGKLVGATAFFPGAYKIGTEAVTREFRILQEYQKIGNIEVRTFPVDHSVPGAMAFLIRTSDAKTIVYTGDMRFHGTRGDLTRKFQDSLKGSKPDALITEGTRIDEDTLDSENNVKENCIKLISDTKGLAMVGFAWKDITRYQTMKEVAKETRRVLVISPKLAYIINKLKGFADLDLEDVSTETNVKVYLKRKGSMLYSKADYVKSKYDAGYSVNWDKNDPSTIDLEHFNNGVRAYEIRKQPSKYLMHLDFYDFNELIDLSPPEDSIYIRAFSEPFNLEMELDEERIKHWLQHFKINTPTNEPIYIHASGHASGPEIKLLIEDIGPKVVYPIHTKHPKLFAEIIPKGTEVRIPEEGRKYPV